MTELRFSLRLPEDLHAIVKQAAEQSGRSMNEQIVYALTQYHGVTSQHERRIATLEQQLADLTAQLAIVGITGHLTTGIGDITAQASGQGE